ncbi:hypothetical protein EIH07_05390 [Chryseobacterium taklimakanense]|uniref:hypothetical protein n=1 Tax=Chryseobacterium taklimakanense TaxID=536441 RepID=UPI000F5F2270|nr:hypothetical protein [Chryseobacterium taklimakanense]AZI22516.1 hypothetical protein EIH07_05390 [Chryseobacterium taklimakanense]
MKNILWLVGLRVIFVLIFSILTAQIQAQNRSAAVEKKYQPLKIGETVPKSIWDFPQEKSPISHSPLRQKDHKLNIIVFWGTGCTSAAQSVTNVPYLQAAFKNTANIVLVSKEPCSLLENYFSSKKTNENFQKARSVCNDKIFHQLFPHYSIPFVVWIKDNRVLNTTDISQLTEDNIKMVLNGNSSVLQTVIQLNSDKPIFLSDDLSSYHKNVDVRNYSVLLKGYVMGLSTGGTVRQEKGVPNGMLFSNLPLSDIYFSLGTKIFKQIGEKTLFNEKRIVYETPNIKEINPEKDNLEWYRKNLYSYDIIVPVEENESLTDYMIQDLNRYTPYQIEFKKILTDCYVLVRTSKADKMSSKSEKRKISFINPTEIAGGKISTLVNILNDKNEIPYPILDETAYEGNVDITLSDSRKITDLQEDFKKYDLTLIKTKRDLTMMVIKDKISKN